MYVLHQTAYYHTKNPCQYILENCNYFRFLSTAVPILIIGNDEESKRLTGHTQYNNNIRFVFSNELVQDHASAGRVFSFWREMSPHQMSHLRKMIKPILSEVKTVPQLRYITLTKWYHTRKCSGEKCVPKHHWTYLYQCILSRGFSFQIMTVPFLFALFF